MKVVYKPEENMITEHGIIQGILLGIIILLLIKIPELILIVPTIILISYGIYRLSIATVNVVQQIRSSKSKW